MERLKQNFFLIKNKFVKKKELNIKDTNWKTLYKKIYPDFDMKTLLEMCEHPDYVVRLILAGRRFLPERIYLKLAEDSSIDVLLALASNIHISQNVVNKLHAKNIKEVSKQITALCYYDDFVQSEILKGSTVDFRRTIN